MLILGVLSLRWCKFDVYVIVGRHNPLLVESVAERTAEMKVPVLTGRVNNTVTQYIHTKEREGMPHD